MHRRVLALAAAALATTPPLVAAAGGLLLGDPGSQGQQRAGAFVAKADDPTALYYNPAGLARARRLQLYVGANVLDLSLRYDRAGVYEAHRDGDPEPAYVGEPYPAVEDGAPPQPVPFLAGSRGLGSRVGLGAGFFPPQGFPNRRMPGVVLTGAGEAPAPQRYDVVEQTAILALPSLGVGVRVLDWVDVGARVTWGFGQVKGKTYVWGMRNEEESIDKDGVIDLDVVDRFAPSFGLGALARPTRWLELGAAYHAAVHFRGRGTATAELGDAFQVGDLADHVEPVPDEWAVCAPGGTVDALKTCANTDVPQAAVVGARVIRRDRRGAEQADLELDVRWEDWSEAGVGLVLVDGQSDLLGRALNPVTIPHGFQDVLSLRLGGSWRLALGRQVVELRAGASYDSAAAPISWTRADLDGMERYMGSFGVAWETGRWRADLGGSYAYSPERTVVDVELGTDPPVAARVQPDPAQPLFDAASQEYSPHNAGHYESSYLVLSTGLTVTW